MIIEKGSKILILEDSSARVKIFNKILLNCVLTFVDMVNDAIYIDKTLGPFDFYFLDHDLEHKAYVPSNDENTGYQFAKYLSNERPTAKVILHTLNFYGAQNMLSILQNAVYIPFTKLANDLTR